MPDKTTDTAIAQQVELAINRLDNVSVMPCTAASFLSQLNQFQLSPSSLAELFEASPSLSVMLFSLMCKQGIGPTEPGTSIRQIIEKISLRQLRDAFLSVKLPNGFLPYTFIALSVKTPQT